MKKIEGEIKFNKLNEFLILILIYNTILRMSGFPEDYAVPQFESKIWAVVVVNIIASIVFTIIVLWEKWREEKERGDEKNENKRY